MDLTELAGLLPDEMRLRAAPPLSPQATQETPYTLDEPLNNPDMVHSVAMMRRSCAAAHEPSARGGGCHA